MDKPIHSLEYLKEKRKQLRTNATPAEVMLWQCLKNKQFHNRKFRRQHSIHNYIVDFYCAEENLIIELDGAHHFNPGMSEHDYDRDQVLSSLGFQIIRFENKRVLQDCEGVLITIASYFNQ